MTPSSPKTASEATNTTTAPTTRNKRLQTKKMSSSRQTGKTASSSEAEGKAEANSEGEAGAEAEAEAEAEEAPEEVGAASKTTTAPTDSRTKEA